MKQIQPLTTAALLLAILLCTPFSSFAQWVQQQIPPGAGMLLSVDFTDSLHGASSGWSWGFNGRAIHTADGGIHWELASVPDSSRSLVTLQMINRDTGFIAGAYNIRPGSGMPSRMSKVAVPRPLARGVERFLQRIGRVPDQAYKALFLRTTDGGRTWESPGALPDSMGYLIGASFVDGRTGYVTGDGLESMTNVAILKTTDGGQHWTRISMPASFGALRSIHALDANHVVAVGFEQEENTRSQGIIVTTTNGGLTWENTAFPLVDNFTDVHFADSSNGYAIGVSTVFKTSDKGVTWQPLGTVPDTVVLQTVRFLPGGDEGIVAGEHTVFDSLGFGVLQPFVARTTNGGITWEEEEIPAGLESTIIVGSDLLSQEQAYMSGGDAAVAVMFRFGKEDAVAGDIVQERTPSEFVLSQNYPNPFNPKTVIEYTIAGTRNSGLGAGKTMLVVYDLLGREVAVLANASKLPGKYRVEFDASRLPSGVYLYRLTVGDFIQTRTMVVLR